MIKNMVLIASHFAKHALQKFFLLGRSNLDQENTQFFNTMSSERLVALANEVLININEKNQAVQYLIFSK